jgi:glucokinase
LHLTLGTGVGGAIIIDGNIYRGDTFGAGELGMMTINFNGPPCLGGNPGAVEAYIGRNYFLNNHRQEIKKLGKHLVPAGFKRGIDFQDITLMAAKNNKTAKALYKKYGFYLGVGLTNYFNLMDVRTCILSGGITNAYKYFIGECIATIKSRSLPTIKNEFKVLKSKISDEAGILGAASLVFQPL